MDNKNHDTELTYIRNRIDRLRKQKGRTEYQMSLDLGHSRSYIQNIIEGRSMLSLDGLLAIFDYFDITPKEFFDSESKNPVAEREIVEKVQNLNEKSQNAVLGVLYALESKDEDGGDGN